MSNWNKTPQDDKSYLVCWYDKDEKKYSSPHRAYYIASQGHFFSLENNNSHPIVADIWYELPSYEEEKK